MSNFSKKRKKSKIILATNQKGFFIGKLLEKSELLVHIAKVSIKKWTTIDFISIRGQQNFKDNAEIKIENDKI